MYLHVGVNKSTLTCMTKADAISIFGTVLDLSEAMNTTRQAIYQWPDELDQRRSDQVTGAAIRLGKLPKSPASLLTKYASCGEGIR